MPESESRIRTVKVRVPSAQVKTIVGSDVTIVPAPGAGKCIVPLRAVLTLDYNTATYVWANADHTLGFNLGGLAFANDAAAQAFIEAASRYSAVLNPTANQAVLTENTALLLQAGGTGEPGTGDSDVIVEVDYKIVDTTDPV